CGPQERLQGVSCLGTPLLLLLLLLAADQPRTLAAAAALQGLHAQSQREHLAQEERRRQEAEHLQMGVVTPSESNEPNLLLGAHRFKYTTNSAEE
ncbi:hypothetical protein Taro_041631, partial [Colocasia esculenta]|nr:hypothetical protein [Colocasia esculenta]